MIRFTIPGRCIPAPRITYHGKRAPRAMQYMKYREEVAWVAKAAGIRVSDKPLKIGIKIYLAKKRGRVPDIDNLTKTILDAMNGVGWRDDSQVMEINAKKIYTSSVKNEKTIVEVEEIEGCKDSA